MKKYIKLKNVILKNALLRYNNGYTAKLFVMTYYTHTLPAYPSGLARTRY